MDVRHISQSISRSAREVYAFAANPDNLPRWAHGLSGSISRDGDTVIADGGPLGKVRVRFAPRNELGVLDHDVTLPDGSVVHNPLRVLPNGAASEVVFTLFRRPGVTDHELEQDAAAVTADLRTLEGLVQQ